MFDWFFRDRRMGAITIAQWPNAPLWTFAVCATLDWLIEPTGGTGTAIRLIGTLALTIWALDELLRGVNPWRRCLGAAVLAALAWKFAAGLTS